MEVRRIIRYGTRYACIAAVLLLLSGMLSLQADAQPATKKYTISNGRMQVTLGKGLSEKELNEFITQYDLGDLALKALISVNFRDSVLRQGWKVEVNNKDIVVISKPLSAAGDIGDPADIIRLAGINITLNGGDPVPANRESFGGNNFKTAPFETTDSTVIFFLQNNKRAKQVLLAGNFTAWQNNAVPMRQTDSGWRLPVKLKPGKYLYKFIVDGNWITDPGNKTTENDEGGNTNSVYFRTNTVFRLDGFGNAKKVTVAGSFNNWNEKELRLTKTAAGWELPVFLDTGTHIYRFIIDGKWMEDPANPDHFPNEYNAFNSVISIGHPTIFRLPGHAEAKQVFLAGSFNGWRNFELQMTKAGNEWQLPYVLGEGNYEYKFYVDGKWADSAGNIIDEKKPGNIFVIGANYIFRLRGYDSAKQVFLAGDFNGWSPNGYAMKKEGDTWVMPVHLTPGKHLYKFVADGQWIRDPGNTLWEQNEFGNGNSVLWVK